MRERSPLRNGGKAAGRELEGARLLGNGGKVPGRDQREENSEKAVRTPLAT